MGPKRFHFYYENHGHGWSQPTCGVNLWQAYQILVFLGLLEESRAIQHSCGLVFMYHVLSLWLPVSVVSTIRTDLSPGLGMLGVLIAIHLTGAKQHLSSVPFSWFLRSPVHRKGPSQEFEDYLCNLWFPADENLMCENTSIIDCSYCFTKLFT